MLKIGSALQQFNQKTGQDKAIMKKDDKDLNKKVQDNYEEIKNTVDPWNW